MKRSLFVLFALLSVVALGAQSFTIVNGTEPVSLDPHAVEGVPEHRIYMALFEGLTIGDPKTNRALPGLAESWSFSKDFKTITFKLRKATWSDGVEITADTVVKSWLRKMDPKNAFQYADLPAAYIEGGMDYLSGKAGPEAVKIRAVDKSTFEVKLVGPTPFFPDMVVHYAFAIVPMHAIEKFGNEWVKPQNWVSNGPFVLKEQKPQERVVVVKNNKYWDAKNVGLKQVTFLANDDVNVGYNLYKSGAADWIDTVPLELMDQIKLDKNFHVAPEYGTYYYIINVTRKPLDDVRVRKALAMAFDKKALVEQVTKGGQIPADSFVPPSTGYTPAKGFAFDPEAARKLLADAGYPGGKGFPSFSILYNTSASHKKIAEFVQAQWKTNLGIDINLVNQEWGTYLDTRSQSHAFDMARAGWIADYLDPSTFSDMWVTGGTQNDGLYSNKRYDELINKARVTSGAERMKALGDAEKVLIDEDMAILPFYFYVTQNMVDLSKWDGWYPNPMNQHPWKFIRPKK